MAKQRKIGVLQGRLTPSNGRGIQFFPHKEWQDEFAAARGIGFDAIELLVKKDSYQKSPLWSRTGRVRIKELAQEHGLSVPSVHGFTLKSPEYSRVAQKLVGFGHEVGAKTILLSFFNDNILRTQKDKQEARERLLGAVEVAEELNMKLAIEAEMPMVELLEFVGAFGSSSVGVYYDVGNMVSMGVDVAEEIKLAGDKIFGVHIKDRMYGNGPSVPIGSGNSDFSSVLSALDKIGYSGHYIMQGARKEGVDDVKLNREYYNFINNLS